MDNCSSLQAVAERAQLSEASSSLRQPAASTPSGEQKGRKVREDYAVVASAVLLPGSAPVSLPQAVAELFPEHFPTATSAKRACRRGEILVDGSVSKLKYQRWFSTMWRSACHVPCHAMQGSLGDYMDLTMQKIPCKTAEFAIILSSVNWPSVTWSMSDARSYF